MRGQTYQWFHTSDTSYRAISIYGDNPETWNFGAHPATDLTVINIGQPLNSAILYSFKADEPYVLIVSIGTNDNNSVNGVTSDQFYNSYIELIEGIHEVWPNTQIVVFVSFSAVGLERLIYSLEQSLWSGFSAVGNTYQQGAGFLTEIEQVIQHYSAGGEESFVHHFNTTGILQHNDIGPQVSLH